MLTLTFTANSADELSRAIRDYIGGAEVETAQDAPEPQEKKPSRGRKPKSEPEPAPAVEARPDPETIDWVDEIEKAKPEPEPETTALTLNDLRALASQMVNEQGEAGAKFLLEQLKAFNAKNDLGNWNVSGLKESDYAAFADAIRGKMANAPATESLL